MAVRVLRSVGHDVVHAAERDIDPGDNALLTEANFTNRIFLTKDHDIGALVHRDLQQHAGVLMRDDLGSADAETALILSILASHGDRLESGAFLRANESGIREAGR
jgi:predicted nuclease of predicted toxin-antitoxin system